MRLLTWNSQDELSLTDNLDTDIAHIPRYAILSHTWGPDNEEVTFDDIQNCRGQTKAGYAKVCFCGEQARRDGLNYFWVDTCCIQKTNESELSQAIRSMFQWYERAEKCYVYLSDVCARSNDNKEDAQHEWHTSFQCSRWFKRGWTLQELLAPKIVQFFSKEENFLGDKHTLSKVIHEATGIPIMALKGIDVDQFPVEERIRWTEKRQTKKIEDNAYCLLGLFKIHMPLMYGEGNHAFIRLRKEINDRWGGNVAARLGRSKSAQPTLTYETEVRASEVDDTDDRTTCPDLMSQVAPPDEQRSTKRSKLSHETTALPSYNNLTYSTSISTTVRATSNNGQAQSPGHDHRPSPLSTDENDALIKSLLFDRIDFRFNNVKRQLPSTCQWLFCHPQFRMWYDAESMDRHNGFFWIRGKPGCGKSTLMKAALEWTKRQKSKGNARKTIIPYFFNARASTSLEKSRLGMYRAVAYHLISVYPTFRRVFLAHFARKDPGSTEDSWTAEELEGFLEDVMEYDEPFELYLFIDALDEAEYDDDIRQMISFLTQLAERIAVIGQNHKLRVCLSSRHYPYIKIGRGLSIVVEAQPEHGGDIQKYIAKELTCDFGPEKDELQSEILRKSSRIFLWVVLVVRILNKLDDRGASLSDMKAHLETVPEDLNQLFTEILRRNDQGVETSMLFFQWVTFRIRPLEPAELFVAMQYSKSPHDQTWTLSDKISIPPWDRLTRFILDCSRGLVEVSEDGSLQAPVVQFIHETVREFLIKKDGLVSIVPTLATSLTGISHEILRIACQRCISTTKIPQEYMGYAKSSHKTNDKHTTFIRASRQKSPFLDYAVSHMLQHADQAQKGSISQGAFLRILIGTGSPVWEHYRLWWNIFERYGTKKIERDMSLLYVAVEQRYLSLLPVLIDVSDTVATACRKYGSLIYMMLLKEHEETVLQALVTREPNNIREQPCTGGDTTKLPEGQVKVLEMLLDRGLDVNARGGLYDNALQAASDRGYEEVVRLLLNRGAKVNMEGGFYGTALQAATHNGYQGIVGTLIDKGADVNLEGGAYGTALRSAIVNDHVHLVQMLLEAGANADGASFRDHATFYEAFSREQDEITHLLLDNVANVNRYTTKAWRDALHGAIIYEKETTVQILLDRGADVRARDKTLENDALHTAAKLGRAGIVQMLLDAGVHVGGRNSHSSSALYIACSEGHKNVVKILLEEGARVGMEAKLLYRTPLVAARRLGHWEIVQMLLDAGAEGSL